MVIRAQPHLASGIVFAQYLFALSVVDAVRSLSGGEDVGVRLKWPNDIYVDRGASVGDAKERYKKLGGILVNSSYAGGAFTLVIGTLVVVVSRSIRASAQAAVLTPSTANRPSLFAIYYETGQGKSSAWSELSPPSSQLSTGYGRNSSRPARPFVLSSIVIRLHGYISASSPPLCRSADTSCAGIRRLRSPRRTSECASSASLRTTGC